MEEVPGDNPSSAGGADVSVLQATLKQQTEEIDRLRAHSNKILDEKKGLQSKYKAYEALGDPETLSNILKQFEGDEDAKLVAEGKFKDVIDKKTQKIRLDYEAKVEELSKTAQQEAEDRSKYEQLYHKAEAEHALTEVAIKAGVEPVAIRNVLLDAQGLFKKNEDGVLESKDNDGNIRTVDGKALTPELFVESLRESCPHYWPKSVSGGATGSSAKGTAAIQEQMSAAIKANDMKKYRELRKKL